MGRIHHRWELRSIPLDRCKQVWRLTIPWLVVSCGKTDECGARSCDQSLAGGFGGWVTVMEKSILSASARLPSSQKRWWLWRCLLKITYLSFSQWTKNDHLSKFLSNWWSLRSHVRNSAFHPVCHNRSWEIQKSWCDSMWSPKFWPLMPFRWPVRGCWMTPPCWIGLASWKTSASSSNSVLQLAICLSEARSTSWCMAQPWGRWYLPTWW